MFIYTTPVIRIELKCTACDTICRLAHLLSVPQIMYATISMIIGGAFYGYVVAMLAALMQVHIAPFV